MFFFFFWDHQLSTYATGGEMRGHSKRVQLCTGEWVLHFVLLNLMQRFLQNQRGKGDFSVLRILENEESLRLILRLILNLVDLNS